MTRISAFQAKKDNSNIFRCDTESREIFRALRKERFTPPTPDQLERFMHHYIATSNGVVDPYPSVDLHLDIAKFKETLNEANQTVLTYFMQGYTAPQIGQRTGRAAKTIYGRLARIFALWKKFYTEED